MHVGVLGSNFGAFHTRIFRENPLVQMVRVLGRDREKLQKLAAQTGAQWTTSLSDILDDPQVELVDVCLPTPLHAPYVVKALQKGKHVFCETPLCTSVEEAGQILRAAEQSGKRVFVDQFILFEFPYEFLQQTTRNASLGKLRALHIHRKTPPLWGDLSLATICQNLMIHELDLVNCILGEPEGIFATGVEGKAGQSHVIAQLRYPGTLVHVQADSMMPLSHAFCVGYEAIFEEGTIEYFENGYADRVESSLELFASKGHETIPIPEQNCYEKTIGEVLRCVQTGDSGRLTLDGAVVSLKLALEIREQASHGKGKSPNE